MSNGDRRRRIALCSVKPRRARAGKGVYCVLCTCLRPCTGPPDYDIRGVAQLFPALPGNPPWPEKEGVVRRPRVPRTKVARCGVCDSFLLASQPTRGRICARLAVYVCAKPHPLLVLLALCGCGSADCALCGAAYACVAQPVPSRSVVSCTSARVIS